MRVNKVVYSRLLAARMGDLRHESFALSKAVST